MECQPGPPDQAHRAYGRVHLVAALSAVPHLGSRQHQGVALRTFEASFAFRSLQRGRGMERLERFYKIDQLLKDRRPVSFSALRSSLGVSAATLKRDLEYMKNRFNAPIEYDREANGYRFGKPRTGPRYELPGLWFNAGEAYALLSMHTLLAELQPGLLEPHVGPLRERLRAILGGEPGREISPQRLVHYRGNWYVDAYCHVREALRSFAVDAIRAAELRDARAKEVPAAELDEHLGAGYGIFAGREVQWASLRFTPEAARWVAAQSWHPRQRARFDQDGSYLLEVPYSHDRELLMELLKFGADVEVLAPESLRSRVSKSLKQAASRYE